METDGLILFSILVSVNNTISRIVTYPKDSKNVTESCKKDNVKYEENSQVVNYLCNHNDNRSKCREYSQEKECLYQECKYEYTHHNSTYQVKWPQK